MNPPTYSKRGFEIGAEAARAKNSEQLKSPLESLQSKDLQVGFFTSLGAKGYNTPLSGIIDQIRDGKWKAEVVKLRGKADDDQAFKKLKKKLPSFMVSASTRGGHKAEDVLSHSGFLQIDIDQVAGIKPEELRDRFQKDPHIRFAFVSPSGQGVKAVMVIPADIARHKYAFNAAERYMLEQYGVSIDTRCSDVSRLCFISHDPDLISNENAIPLSVSACQGIPLSTPPPPKKSSSPSSILNPESCILHNNSLFKEWPELKPIYWRQAPGRLRNIQRGQRNKAIVEIVADLFCVVNQEFAIGMAREFTRVHEDIYSDYPVADFEREALSVWQGCERSYPGRLSELEKAAYLELPDDKSRAAFRIAQSLSQCCSPDAAPPPTFYLSCHQLGIRLGLFDSEADRILKDLQRRHIIAKLENGTLRVKGQRGKASLFTWQFEPCSDKDCEGLPETRIEMKPTSQEEPEVTCLSLNDPKENPVVNTINSSPPPPLSHMRP
jgi:hypothetical protein